MDNTPHDAPPSPQDTLSSKPASPSTLSLFPTLERVPWFATVLLVSCLLSLVVGLLGIRPPEDADRDANTAKNDASGKTLKRLISNLPGDAHLLKIDLTGPITMESAQETVLGSGESNAVQARKALEFAQKTPEVKGVLLLINSPGGTVGMSQELNAAVKRVKAKKPVLAYMGDVAASGGYYTACAATEIMANPGTLTGSIGVIISSLNFQSLMQDKLGVTATTIKSGRYKDLLSPYRKNTSDELALLQKLIDTSYQDFLGAVLEGRTAHLPPSERAARAAKIRAVADGRIVLGTVAKEEGLVDEIGDIDAAYTRLDKLARQFHRLNAHGETRLPLKDFSNKESLMELLGIPLNEALARLIPQAHMGPDFSRSIPLSLQYPKQPLWMLE